MNDCLHLRPLKAAIDSQMKVFSSSSAFVIPKNRAKDTHTHTHKIKSIAIPTQQNYTQNACIHTLGCASILLHMILKVQSWEMSNASLTGQPNLIMTSFQLAALIRAQRGCDTIQHYITEVTASHNDRLMVNLHHTVQPKELVVLIEICIFWILLCEHRWVFVDCGACPKT